MILAWQCLAVLIAGLLVGFCVGVVFATKMAAKDLAALAKVIRTL